MRRVLTAIQARQGIGPKAMFWVLVAPLSLAVLAGFVLALDWINLPWTAQ